jgi:FG-GAP-like repeat
VIAKDLNADGKVDLVTANQASLSVLMGNGNGTFGAATSRAILPNFFHGLGSVTAPDLTGDGKPSG